MDDMGIDSDDESTELINDSGHAPQRRDDGVSIRSALVLMIIAVSISALSVVAFDWIFAHALWYRLYEHDPHGCFPPPPLLDDDDESSTLSLSSHFSVWPSAQCGSLQWNAAAHAAVYSQIIAHQVAPQNGQTFGQCSARKFFVLEIIDSAGVDDVARISTLAAMITSTLHIERIVVDYNSLERRLVSADDGADVMAPVSACETWLTTDGPIQSIAKLQQIRQRLDVRKLAAFFPVSPPSSSSILADIDWDRVELQVTEKISSSDEGKVVYFALRADEATVTYREETMCGGAQAKRLSSQRLNLYEIVTHRAFDDDNSGILTEFTRIPQSRFDPLQYPTCVSVNATRSIPHDPHYLHIPSSCLHQADIIHSNSRRIHMFNRLIFLIAQSVLFQPHESTRHFIGRIASVVAPNSTSDSLSLIPSFAFFHHDCTDVTPIFSLYTAALLEHESQFDENLSFIDLMTNDHRLQSESAQWSQENNQTKSSLSSENMSAGHVLAMTIAYYQLKESDRGLLKPYQIGLSIYRHRRFLHAYLHETLPECVSDERSEGGESIDARRCLFARIYFSAHYASVLLLTSHNQVDLFLAAIACTKQQRTDCARVVFVDET